MIFIGDSTLLKHFSKPLGFTKTLNGAITGKKINNKQIKKKEFECCNMEFNLMLKPPTVRTHSGTSETGSRALYNRVLTVL